VGGPVNPCRCANDDECDIAAEDIPRQTLRTTFIARRVAIIAVSHGPLRATGQRQCKRDLGSRSKGDRHQVKNRTKAHQVSFAKSPYHMADAMLASEFWLSI